VLSLHCVGCWGNLLAVLKDELGKTNDNSSSNVSGILLHSCNSLPQELVKEYSALPVPTYFSLNGKVSQTNEDMKRMIKAIPSQSLLIETDSPDQLIPSLAHDGIQFNEPFYLTHTAEIIAEILGMSTTELSKLTFTNANNLFKPSIENNENNENS
jgi:TatD DNase family protein